MPLGLVEYDQLLYTTTSIKPLIASHYEIAPKISQGKFGCSDGITGQRGVGLKKPPKEEEDINI